MNVTDIHQPRERTTMCSHCGGPTMNPHGVCYKHPLEDRTCHRCVLAVRAVDDIAAAATDLSPWHRVAWA